MAHTELTHTQMAERNGPTGYHAENTGTKGVVSIVTGALGVVAAFLPFVTLASFLFAAVAFVTGFPALKDGPKANKHAKMGIALGVTAVVVGLLMLAINFDLFDYFSSPSD